LKGCGGGLHRLSASTVCLKIACFLAMSTSILVALWAFSISSTAGILQVDLGQGGISSKGVHRGPGEGIWVGNCEMLHS